MKLLKAAAMMLLTLLTACLLFVACDGKEYAVTVAQCENGTVTASQTSAKDGTAVELTAVPDDGYALSELKVNGESVMAMVVDGKYSFAIKKDTNVEAEFSLLSYTITYKDGAKVMTGLEPATYNVTQTVTLPTPENKDGLVFAGWFEQASLQGEAVTSLSGVTGDKVFYAKWAEQVYAVEGSVASDTYEAAGTAYDLYDIDYAAMTVVYTDEEAEVSYTATPDASGAYTISVPEGVYAVTFEYANFTSVPQTVEVNENGATQETAENTALTVDTPVLAGKPTAASWTFTDQMNYWTIENGVATTKDGAGRALYFAGLSASDTFMVEATLKSTADKNDTDKSRSLGITYAAYGASTRDAVMMQMRTSSGGAANAIRLWNTGAWGEQKAFTFDADKEYRMTLVKSEGTVYVYIDGAYAARFAAGETDGEFAIQIVGGFAQVWDWKYSYNEELIAAMIGGGSVQAVQPAAGGSVEVTPAGALKLGDTVTARVTVQEGYKLTALTVGGTDVLGEAVYEGGAYVYTFTVMQAKAYEVNATLEAKQKYAVTFEGQNATVTVKADGVEIQSGDEVYEGAQLTVVAEADENYALQAINVTMGGEPVSGFASGVPFAVSGNVEITLEIVEAIPVSGSVKSATYEVGGQQYDLYALDYSKLQVVYTKDSVAVKATPNSEGSYSLSLSSGTYAVTFEYENFVSAAQTVVVSTDGVSEGSTEVIVTVPDLAGKPTASDWTGADQTNFWTIENGVATTTDGAGRALYFAGLSASDTFMVEATMKSTADKNGTDKTRALGLTYAAYADTREAVMMQMRTSNGGAANAVRLWKSVTASTWGEQVSYTFDADKEYRMTLVKSEGSIWVYIDGEFAARFAAGSSTGEFAIQVVAGFAQVRDWKYSYNTELIDAMTKGGVQATQPAAGGSVEVTPAGALKLGDTVTVKVTPEEGYKLTTLMVGGVNVVEALEEENGAYVYTFTVMQAKAYEVNATLEAKQKYAVTFEGQNATVTVKADGVEIQSGDEVYEGAQLTVVAEADENYALQAINVTMGGEPVSGFASGVPFAVSGNVEITLEIVEAIPVSGSVKSATYEVGGQQYDLYALDYSKLQVVYTKDSVAVKATPNSEGSYSLSLSSGTYAVTFEYENFVSAAQTVVVSTDGVSEGSTALTVAIPEVAASTEIGGATLTGGNGTRYDLSNAALHEVSIPKGYDADCYLVGTGGTKVMFEAVLKNAVSNGTGSAERFQAGIIFQAYGTTKTRNAILFDQTNAVAPYTNNLVRPWLNNGWNNTGLVGDIEAVANMKTEDGVRLTVVRDGTTAYVFIDGVLVTTLTGLSETAGALGFQTLSKTGVTFSNYVYSYNAELIDAMIAQAQ